MRTIGSILQSIFSLEVSCFTGCYQKSDYTKLQRQYPLFGLTDKAISKMDDVSVMAVNRGIVTRGPGKTQLQELCKGQKLHLPKSRHVRVGTVFASKAGSLSHEAKLYCQLDVEAPLLLHDIYCDYPDLTKRLKGGDSVEVGDKVDIMPQKSSSLKPIAQGKIIMVGGKHAKWGTHKYKLGRSKVAIDIEKVFDPKGIIHYPMNKHRCFLCGCHRKTHGSINDDCDFYLFQQFGKPPYSIVELKSRIRLSHPDMKYADCIFATESGTNIVANNVGRTDLSAEGCNLDAVDSEHPADEDLDENDDDLVEEENEVADRLSSELHEFLLNEANVIDGERDNSNVANFENNLAESHPTQMQLSLLTNDDLQKAVQDIILQADSLAATNNSSFVFDEFQQTTVASLHHTNSRQLERTVLGDAFHFMDRTKVPTHHDYKALYFRSLRSAMFIMHQGDVENVRAVLSRKQGQTWEKKMAFDFNYIAQRVRRRIPPAQILHRRMQYIYHFFRDKVDSRTGNVLFNEAARKKFELVMALVQNGYASDPSGISMYVRKTNKHGKQMVDMDGLQLYRSLRGTSNLESLHQYFTTSFGHTNSGPRYSDMLLMVIRHQYNWRASLHNRPYFPPLSHYNGLLIDRINELYEEIYGHPKYKHWISFNESLPGESPYGIVPVDSFISESVHADPSDIQNLKYKDTLKYLAKRQKSDLPFLPVRGSSELKLFNYCMEIAIKEEHSITKNTNSFNVLAEKWNQSELSVSESVFPKLPIHLCRHYKNWSKNQSVKDAEITSGAAILNQGLDYAPGVNKNHASSIVFRPVPIDFDLNAVLNEEPETAAIDNEDYINNSTTELSISAENISPPKRKRERRCKVIVDGKACPSPATCPGRNFRINCILNTCGEKAKKVKRNFKKSNITRKCQVCGSAYCTKGISKRSRCPKYDVPNRV